MRPRTLTLSARKLANIPSRPELNDFEFTVGNFYYSCPKFVADFLSTKIGRQHEVDCTISAFVVATGDRESCFQSFLGLGRGQKVVNHINLFRLVRARPRRINAQRQMEQPIACSEK
jgi:hypothetical protein